MAKRLTHDEAAEVMRAAGLEPLEPYPGAGARWRSVCGRCGAEVTPTLSNVKAGKPCGPCGLRRRATTRTTPADTAAELLRAAGFEPLEPFAGAQTTWRSRCLVCGFECAPKLAKIRSRGGGCPRCGQERRAASRRTNATDAAAVMVAAGLEPLTPYPGNKSRQWSCRCTRCHRTFDQTLSNVKAGGSCPYCSGWLVHEDTAANAMRSAGYEPLAPYPGADSPWPCRCLTCNRESTPSWSAVKIGRRCGYCSGVRIDPADAEAAMRAAGLEPLTPYPGNNKSRWPARCLTCEREVYPSFASVRDGGGCRFCATHGLNLTAPGVVYLVTSAPHFALKVGVTSEAATEDRLAMHARHGWTLAGRWTTPSGEAALTVERSILEWWRTVLDAPVAVTKDEMRQGGWTETVSLRWVDVAETADRVAALVAFIVSQPRA